ncbi:MAG TPA: hypothetical protein PKE07_05950 [Lacibacter sp.]|nr:hypothetical protein [Lacibacter sp.]HMO89073.1 hypothetical protein [Lacibacter sp.]
MKLRLFLALTAISLHGAVLSQQIFDANFANISFPDASRTLRVGNGQAAGNIVTYSNVITIGSQPIDCIIRTVSITNGTFTLPGSAAAGTTAFDYGAATGTGMSGNENRFFSPTFNFSTGGGNCRFRFEFILGGSYNTTTNTGTPVILENVYVNTYDIDGNGGASSNQFNEFGGFAQAQLLTGTGSNISVSYNATTGLTRFASNTNTNITNITADATRIRVGYGNVSSFEIAVGSLGSGAAYFFLDLGIGPAWTATPTTQFAPALDLNTTTPGVNNSVFSCAGLEPLTTGTTNITTVSTVNVNEIVITFPSAEIADANDEVFIPNQASPTLDNILLGFTGSGSQSFSIGGVSYTVARSVTGGTRRLGVTRTTGTLTKAEAEAFLDALHYSNKSLAPTAGNRNFTVTIRENPYVSPATLYLVDVSCSTLPVRGLQLNAVFGQGEVTVQWTTEQEAETDFFEVERSTDLRTFTSLGKIQAAGTSLSRRNYQYRDRLQDAGAATRIHYRIRQVDMNGASVFSKTVTVNRKFLDLVSVRTNPFREQLVLELRFPATRSLSIQLLDQLGRPVRTTHTQMPGGNQQVLLSGLDQFPAGTYYLRLVDGEDVRLIPVTKGQ